MRTLTVPAVLAVVLAAGSGQAADLQNAVEVCGNPDADAADIVRFCRMALDTGKLDPREAAQVNANLGVGYFDQGQYELAAEAYTAALATSPDMVAALINRARAYERLDRLPEAAADYTRALQLDPGAADAHLGRGALLLRHGDPERAVADFSDAIRAQPDWIAPYFNRGVAWLALGSYENALKDFSWVIRQTPDDAAAWMNRGRAKAALKMPDAAADFDKAIALDPEWGGAWFMRGRFHDERGQREAANADFLRAYELGYPDPWLISRVREIAG